MFTFCRIFLELVSLTWALYKSRDSCNESLFSDMVNITSLEWKRSGAHYLFTNIKSGLKVRILYGLWTLEAESTCFIVCYQGQINKQYCSIIWGSCFWFHFLLFSLSSFSNFSNIFCAKCSYQFKPNRATNFSPIDASTFLFVYRKSSGRTRLASSASSVMSRDSIVPFFEEAD